MKQMDEVERYLAVMDPFPAEGGLERVRQLIRVSARRLTRARPENILLEANALARVVSLGGRLGANASDETGQALERWGVREADNELDLRTWIAAVLGARQFVRNVRLQPSNETKRDCLAVGLWCALSFQENLREPRMEALRGSLLRDAQEAALRMASRVRSEARCVTDGHDVGDEEDGNVEAVVRENDALRDAVSLAREEADLLRWMIADESRVLGRRFQDVHVPEAAVVARGLEVGRLLRWFPTVEHWQFVSSGSAVVADVDLGDLVGRLGVDRRRMGEAYVSHELVDSCPLVFPLLGALSGGDVKKDGGTVKRSLSYWCGRALLESAAMSFAEEMMGE